METKDLKIVNRIDSDYISDLKTKLESFELLESELIASADDLMISWSVLLLLTSKSYWFLGWKKHFSPWEMWYR